MKRWDEWRPVLNAELKRWSALSCEELASLLAEEQAYEVEHDCKTYQVEVHILENTDTYIHVSVAVDDGHLWRAMRPLVASFIRRKQAAPGG